MATRFSAFMAELEREAKDEGPAAVAELRLLRERFTFARQFMQARRERGLTQQALAKTTGLHQSEISDLESGRANPTYRTLQTLATALGGRLQLVLKSPRRAAAHKVARKHRRARDDHRLRR